MNCDICKEQLTGDVPANPEYCIECFHLLHWVRTYVATIYGPRKPGNSIMPEDTFLDLGVIDSLDNIEMVLETEDTFNIEIPDSDAESLMDIRQFICYLRNHGASWSANHDLKPITKGFIFRRIDGWEPVE